MYLALKEQEMEDKKPAIRSLGVISSLSSIGAIIALVTELRSVWDSIPPELLEDTRLWVFSFVALMGQLGALWGRWRAVTKIGGLFRVK